MVDTGDYYDVMAPDEQQERDFRAGWARAAADSDDYNPYPDETDDPDLPSVRSYLQAPKAYDLSWSYPYNEPWCCEELCRPVCGLLTRDWLPRKGENWEQAGYRWLDDIFGGLLGDDYDVYLEWLEDQHYQDFQSGVLRAAQDDLGYGYSRQLEDHDLEDRPWCQPWTWDDEPDWRPPRGGDVWDMNLYFHAGEAWYRTHRDEIQQSIPLIV